MRKAISDRKKAEKKRKEKIKQKCNLFQLHLSGVLHLFSVQFSVVFFCNNFYLLYTDVDHDNSARFD